MRGMQQVEGSRGPELLVAGVTFARRSAVLPDDYTPSGGVCAVRAGFDSIKSVRVRMYIRYYYKQA